MGPFLLEKYFNTRWQPSNSLQLLHINSKRTTSILAEIKIPASIHTLIAAMSYDSSCCGSTSSSQAEFHGANTSNSESIIEPLSNDLTSPLSLSENITPASLASGPKNTLFGIPVSAMFDEPLDVCSTSQLQAQHQPSAETLLVSDLTTSDKNEPVKQDFPSNFPYEHDFGFDFNFGFNFGNNFTLPQDSTSSAIDLAQQQLQPSTNSAGQPSHTTSGLVGPDEYGGFWDSAGNLYNSLGLPMYSGLSEDQLHQSFSEMLARELPGNTMASTDQHFADVLESQHQTFNDAAQSTTQVSSDNSITSNPQEFRVVNTDRGSPSPSTKIDIPQSQDSQSSVPELTHSSPIPSPSSSQPVTPTSDADALMTCCDKVVAATTAGMTNVAGNSAQIDLDKSLGGGDLFSDEFDLFGDGDYSFLQPEPPSKMAADPNGTQLSTNMDGLAFPAALVQNEQNNITKSSPQTQFNLTLPTLPDGNHRNGVTGATVQNSVNPPPGQDQFQPIATNFVNHSPQVYGGQILNREQFLNDYLSARGFAFPDLTANGSKTQEEIFALVDAEASYAHYLMAIEASQARARAPNNNFASSVDQHAILDRGYGSIPINMANAPSPKPRENFDPTGWNNIPVSSNKVNAPAPKARSRAQPNKKSAALPSQTPASNNPVASAVTAKTQARNRKMQVQPVAQDGPPIPIRNNDGQIQMVRPDVYYHEAVLKTYLPPLSPVLQAVKLASMVDNSGVTAKTRARNPKLRVSQPVAAQQSTITQQTPFAPQLMGAQQHAPVQQWAPVQERGTAQKQSAYLLSYGSQSGYSQQPSYAPQVRSNQPFVFNQQSGMHNHSNFNQQSSVSQRAGMNRQSPQTIAYNPQITIGIDDSDGLPMGQSGEVKQVQSQFQPNSKDQPIVVEDDKDEEAGLFATELSTSSMGQLNQPNQFTPPQPMPSSCVQVEEPVQTHHHQPQQSLKRSHEFENIDEYEEFQQWMAFRKMKKARASGSQV